MYWTPSCLGGRKGGAMGVQPQLFSWRGFQYTEVPRPKKLLGEFTVCTHTHGFHWALIYT